MKRQIFNNKEVSALLERHCRHPHSQDLKQKLMERIYPLIDAAITKKRLFHLRDDLRQECALKVLKGLTKYNAERGSAFAFLWSTICNCLQTQGKRLSRGGISLEEESIQREAEVSGAIIFQSPEYQYLQKIIAATIDTAISSGELRTFHRSKDRKALDYIRQSILNGDLFSKKLEVFKQLKRIGIRKKDAQLLMDYVIVNLRANLYSRKDMLNALAHRKTVHIVAQQPDS